MNVTCRLNFIPWEVLALPLKMKKRECLKRISLSLRHVRFTQHMVFEGGMFAGQAKGLRVVCEERFGADAVKGSI